MPNEEGGFLVNWPELLEEEFEIPQKVVGVVHGHGLLIFAIPFPYIHSELKGKIAERVREIYGDLPTQVRFL